jgi:hypothetical protein
LNQVIINRGSEPEETPDHNAMQVKFLDDEFCRIRPRRQYESCSCETSRRAASFASTHRPRKPSAILRAEVASGINTLQTRPARFLSEIS